ncbi:MAG: hypothetical protein AVDCRST_MAG08-2180, partial [uncultured Acetobacteraceae bacterium]
GRLEVLATRPLRRHGRRRRGLRPGGRPGATGARAPKRLGAHCPWHQRRPPGSAPGAPTRASRRGL